MLDSALPASQQRKQNKGLPVGGMLSKQGGDMGEKEKEVEGERRAQLHQHQGKPFAEEVRHIEQEKTESYGSRG